MENIEKQIIKTIEKIQPFLNQDGGGVEFVSYKDGIVYIKMLGACTDCLNLDVTIKQGVEIILIEEVPGVVAVEVVKE